MSDIPVNNEAMVPNAKRLLWAGSMGIFAAGAGLAIRGGILHNWGAEFGFNAAQLGAISGAGFSGFCFGIIVGGLLCDKIGYGKLVALAFALHILSAVVTFTAGGHGAYNGLYWGMLIFAYANGTLESVANPLIATLFPHNRAHFLNILHASWPAASAAPVRMNSLRFILSSQYVSPPGLRFYQPADFHVRCSTNCRSSLQGSGFFVALATLSGASVARQETPSPPPPRWHPIGSRDLDHPNRSSVRASSALMCSVPSRAQNRLPASRSIPIWQDHRQ
jgi:MFS family permease